MTVKQLIEELKKFDENLTVVCQSEEYDEPSPHIVTNEYDSSYWAPSINLITLPKNIPYVIL